MKLGQQIKEGIRWTGASSLLLLVGYFVVYGVLFHLVLPQEFAVFSLAQGIAGLALNVATPAFGYAIVAKATLSISQFSAVFWLNLFLTSMLGGLIWFSADWVASFYGHYRLAAPLQVISWILPVASIGASFRYLLQRESKFRDMSVIRLVAFFAFTIVSIWGARLGYGALALIVAFISQTAVESIFFLIVGGKLMNPVHAFQFRECRYFLRFGFLQGGERFVDTLGSQVDTYLIGKLLGMETLGVYEAAKRILMRPLNLLGDAVETVLFPVMAKRQNETQTLKTLFLKNVKFLGLCGNLPYLLVAVFSLPVAALFVGNQWQDVGQVFGLYAFVMLFRIPRMPTDVLLMSKGKPDWWLIWKFVVLFLTSAMISISSSAGLSRLLIGLIALQFILLILNHQFLTQKLVQVTWKEFFRIILVSLFPAIISSILAYLVCLLFTQPVFQIIFGGLSAGCVYFVWIINFNNADVLAIFRLFK